MVYDIDGVTDEVATGLRSSPVEALLPPAHAWWDEAAVWALRVDVGPFMGSSV